jgi:peptidyl-prolyl cis-trans isomerase B (cyclophilin B)
VSQQTPYESAIHEQPAYGHGVPAYAPGPQKTNTMAILGLIFAFVFSPLGIVFSAIGLSQIKKRREGGRGLAIAGLILSIVFFLITLAAFVFVFAAVNEAVETAEQAEATAAAEGSGEDPEGTLAACEVIAPAILGFEADMASVTTPEEYALVITDVRATIEDAATLSSDAVFVGDVQALSADLQLASDTVMNGEDPTYLEGVLGEDGARVDSACATAGYAP